MPAGRHASLERGGRGVGAAQPLQLRGRRADTTQNTSRPTARPLRGQARIANKHYRHSDLCEMNCTAGARALTNKNDVVGIYSARGSKGNVRFALGLPPQTPPVPECDGTRIGGRQGREPHSDLWRLEMNLPGALSKSLNDEANNIESTQDRGKRVLTLTL